MQVLQIPIDRIYPDPNNPRKEVNPEYITSLAQSLKQYGIQVPLIGYRVGEQILLCDGHCRLAAARAIRIKEVPIHVRDAKPNEQDLLLIQLTISAHRRGLNPVDEYEGFKRLANFHGWSASQLAEALAISNSEVTRTMSLGQLSEEDLQRVREGKISKSAAYALTRVPPEQRAELAKKAAAGELTRDQLNAQARKKPKKKDEKKSHRVTCETVSGTISIRSPMGLDLQAMVELLEDLLRECRKARSQGLDISTAVSVMRDRARIQSTSTAGA